MTGTILRLETMISNSQACVLHEGTGESKTEPPSPRTITVLDILKVAGGHDEGDASKVKSEEGKDKLG